MTLKVWRKTFLSLITKEQAFSLEDIASIHVPCLVMGSELIWLKGIGHMRLKTSANVINLSIESFMKKVESSSYGIIKYDRRDLHDN